MDMQTSRGIPLRADPDSIRALSMRSLSRAALAAGMKAFDAGSMGSATSSGEFLRRRGWADDRIALSIVRGAVGPALTGQPIGPPSWASSAWRCLETLKPMSAGAQLLSQVLQVSLDDVAQVRLPTIQRHRPSSRSKVIRFA